MKEVQWRGNLWIFRRISDKENRGFSLCLPNMTQGVFVAVKHSGISYRRFSHFLPKTKTRLVKPPRAVFNLNDLCLGRDQTCLRIQAASEEVTQQLGNVVIGPPFFFFSLQHIDWKVSLNSIQSQWWEHFHFPTKLSLLSFTVFWCVLIYYIHLPVPCRGRHSSALFWHETKLLLRDLNRLGFLVPFCS